MKEQLSFLQLLTICGNKQVEALLDTISDNQANAVSAVFKNIRLTNIPLSKRDQSALLKKKNSFILLTSVNSSPPEKITIIKTETKQIFYILKKVIGEVIDLLE